MTRKRSHILVSFAIALLVQACSSTPEQTVAVPMPEKEPAAVDQPTVTPVPELELNLPQQTPLCDCPEEDEDKDYTFLEKGYRALLDGEYEEAMDYFLRYQRLESSPRAQLEAGIAITYVQMLPRSNYYNPEIARSSFNVLRKQNAKALGVHDYTRLMRQSLINFVIVQNQLDDLRSKNQNLQGELDKREDALKKLRDLTLGQ
ncbi:MAG: hypothetical protein AAGI44_05455 [Pseudomonadota bacterium]